ncbi:MAG: peptidoglycan-binding domain-containing protein [Patescibacteria group bacterium]
MSRLRKFGTVAIALVVALSMTGTPASAQSVDINALLAQIAQLQAQVASMQTGTPAASSSYTFTKDLTLGAKGADVSALQQILINGGYLKIAAPTSYFGPATKAALVAWQKAAGVTPASGYFGPKTRTAMAGTPGTPGTPVVLPTSAFLKVEAAGPAATTIPDGSLYNKVLKLKFTAGSQAENVTAVTVTRGGYTANTNITGVSVWDDNGNRYGNIISALTADGKATVSFPGTPFVVPAGQTKYLTVAVNLSSDANSGSLSFAVNAVTDITVATGSSQPSGAFPLMGGIFTTVDGSTSLGNVYLDDQSVAGLTYSTISSNDGNVEVGDTQKEVFKLRVVQNNSKEGVNLEKVVLYVEGTIQEAKDVKNWKLYSPEGNVLATASAPVDRYVSFVLATPYMVDKGLTKDFSVKADIMDGSNNYFRVYVMNDYDVVARGVTTGGAIQVLDSAGAALTGSDTQNTNGGFKIKQGALTVSKASGSATGSVAPSAQNVSLAKFDLKAAGETLEIRKLGIQVQYPTYGLALTGTISVKDATSGETYLSISADTSNLQAISVTDPGAYQRDLSSYITIPSGQTKTIEVTGTVSANATSSSNYTVSVGKFYTKRYSTNDYTDLATSEREANNITVGDVSLTVTKNTSFASTNRAAGATNVKVGEFVFQASSADDVRVNSINFTIATSSYLQNLKLMDGTTQLGSTIGSPSASSNTFTTNLTVAKSSSKVLSLYADVLSSAVADQTIIISVGDAGVSGYGVASGKSLSSTPSGAKEGQTITVKSATLTIAADAATPLAKVLIAGQTGVEISKIKFESANEDLTLKRVTFSFESASTTEWAAATAIQQNFSKVYLYDGSTLLNTGGTVPQSGDVLMDGLTFSLPAGTPKVLTVKADITDQETISPKAVGRVVVKSTSTTDMKVSSSQGDMSTGLTLTSNAASNYMLVTAAAPVIANAYTGTLTPAGSASEEVARFTISNPGTRDITLSSTTINVALTPNGATSTLDTWKLYESGDLTNSIDTDNTSLSSASATSTNITFGSFSPAQTISANGSKTYVVKANTASACTKNSTFTGSCKVTVKVNGSKGYSASEVGTKAITAEEYYWADGVVSYSYTTTGSAGATYSNLNVSDSGEVLGATLTY